MTKVDWQLSGLGSEQDELASPVDPASWKRPWETWLEDDGRTLAYRFSIDHDSALGSAKRVGEWLVSAATLPPMAFPRYTSSRPAMLVQFLRLAEGTAADIARYANRWGVLDICELHGLPSSHHQTDPIPSAEDRERNAEIAAELGHQPSKPLMRLDTLMATMCSARWVEGVWFEPVEAWRENAAAMSEVLNNAAAVGDSGDSGARERVQIQSSLNRMIRRGAVRPRVVFDDRLTPTIELQGEGLYGALVVQLMAAAGGLSRTAACSSCGDRYSPSRRPNPDRRRYCPTCVGRKVPGRDAARDYRANKTKHG